MGSRKKILRKRSGRPDVIIKPLKYKVLPNYILKMIEKYKSGKKLTLSERTQLAYFYNLPFNILEYYLQTEDYYLEYGPKCPRCGDYIKICYYPPRLGGVKGKFSPFCKKCVLELYDIEKCKKTLIKKIKNNQRITHIEMLPLIAYYEIKPTEIYYHFKKGDYELKYIKNCKMCGKKSSFYAKGRTTDIGYRDYCPDCIRRLKAKHFRKKVPNYLHLKKSSIEKSKKTRNEKWGHHYFAYILKHNVKRKISSLKQIEHLVKNSAKRKMKEINYDENLYNRLVANMKKKNIENAEEKAKLWLILRNDRTWWENAILHEGITIKELTQIFGLSKSTISNVLRKMNLNPKKLAQMDEEEIEKMGDLEKRDQWFKNTNIIM